MTNNVSVVSSIGYKFQYVLSVHYSIILCIIKE